MLLYRANFFAWALWDLYGMCIFVTFTKFLFSIVFPSPSTETCIQFRPTGSQLWCPRLLYQAARLLFCILTNLEFACWTLPSSMPSPQFVLIFYGSISHYLFLYWPIIFSTFLELRMDIQQCCCPSSGDSGIVHVRWVFNCSVSTCQPTRKVCPVAHIFLVSNCSMLLFLLCVNRYS